MDMFYDKIAKVYPKSISLVNWTQKKLFSYTVDIACDYRDANKSNLSNVEIYRDQDKKIKQLDTTSEVLLAIGDRVELFSNGNNDGMYVVLDVQQFNDPYINLNNILYVVRQVDG